MRLLINFHIDKDLESALVGDNVIYRPDLEQKGAIDLAQALATTMPDVLITRAVPDAACVARWREMRMSSPVFIVCIGDGRDVRERVADIPLYWVATAGSPRPEVRAFMLAERLHSEQLDEAANRPLRTALTRKRRRGPAQVALVGAGAVNLITAYWLNRRGYRVSVFDAAADPRRGTIWSELGCTHGGGDARMFSLTEARHHGVNFQSARGDRGAPFNSTIADHGWLFRQPDSSDRQWIADYMQVPAWLPPVFDADIISFNQESAPIWRSMREQCPSLFEGVGFVDKVVRLYSTEQQYTAAIAHEGRIGALRRIISAAELSREYPALAPAVEQGALKGGLEVVGFTLNIHKFSAKLLDYLEAHGVQFNWHRPIDAIDRDADASVRGLVAGADYIRADHYVLSPGAYGNALLNGTASGGKIAGIVGAWLSLPNVAPKLDVSLKISRAGFGATGAAECANVITGADEGGDVIHISAGHGFVGRDARAVDGGLIGDLFRVVEETAQHYFPAAYAAAKENGRLAHGRRWCVRPWTPSGLGLFEMVPAQDHGALIVTGGHNTGGFAQAPSVAMAVLAALAGERHDMHRAYHPERVRQFVMGTTDRPAAINNVGEVTVAEVTTNVSR